MENQINVDEHEQKVVEEINEQKKIWFGESNLSFKKRLYQFIATLISTLIFNFGTKLKWQIGLVLYLIIVCPIGTYQIIKTIINWIF